VVWFAGAKQGSHSSCPTARAMHNRDIASTFGSPPAPSYAAARQRSRSRMARQASRQSSGVASTSEDEGIASPASSVFNLVRCACHLPLPNLQHNLHTSVCTPVRFCLSFLELCLVQLEVVLSHRLLRAFGWVETTGEQHRGCWTAKHGLVPQRRHSVAWYGCHGVHVWAEHLLLPASSQVLRVRDVHRITCCGWCMP